MSKSSTVSLATGKAHAPVPEGGPAKPVVKFRMRVMAGDSIAIGPGKIALLEAVDTTGSITAAAKSLGMSYRRAWLLLDELNRCSKKPVIDSAQGGAQGGGSVVTAEGRKLIALYRRVEQLAARSCRSELQALLRMLSP